MARPVPAVAGGWAVTAVAAATGFVTMLDNTVVMVAAPSIAADLGTSLPALEWVATGYMIPYAGLMLVGGRLADRYGHRVALLAGLALFTAASLAAGAARTAALLVAARVVQGAAAAVLVPATLAAVAVGGDRARLRATAAWTVSGATALAAGPVLGGLVSQHRHWSWIFLLNVPVGLAMMAVAGCAVRPGAGRRTALDAPGMWTGTIALSAVAYALTGGTAHGWGRPAVLGAAVLGAAALASFVIVERRAPAPLVDVRLFAVPAFAGGVAVQVLWGLGVTGLFFYTAVYLQDVLGYSPSRAGLVFLPTAAAVALAAPVAPAVVRRYGAGRTAAAGLGLVAAGLVAIAVAVADPAVLLTALTVIGLGSGLTVPVSAVVLAAAPPERAGMAAGVLGVAREASGVLGIAGIGVVVAGGQGPDGLARGYLAGLIVAAALTVFGAFVAARTLPGPDPAGAGSRPGPDPAGAGSRPGPGTTLRGGPRSDGHAEGAHQPRPGGVQLALPVRPGVGAVEVDVGGGRDQR